MASVTYTEAEITESLMALIAWAGNATAAKNALEAEGKRCPTSQTLTEWSRSRYAARFEELNDKYKEQLETQLASQYRYAARRAVDVQLLALEKAHDRLTDGKDQDPSRTAANAATVADKMTGKLLALTGRPTSIREDRNLEEILRGLVAKKVLELPSAPGVPHE